MPEKLSAKFEQAIDFMTKQGDRDMVLTYSALLAEIQELPDKEMEKKAGEYLKMLLTEYGPALIDFLNSQEKNNV